jgi:TolA-binding protein
MKLVRAIPVLAVALGTVLGAAQVMGAGTTAAEKSSSGAKGKELSSECVTPEARTAINECPGGPKQFEVNKARPAAFKSAPPPREKRTSTEAKPGNPTEEMGGAAVRDQRKNRLQARAQALLISEIQNLEGLFESTPKKSPDRPQLIRRLAEGYVELESAAQRERIQSEIKIADSKKKKLKNTAARDAAIKAKKTEEVARQQAIKYYTLMKNEYPNYSKLDEVLYYLAYEYEQAKDLKNARKVYYELIQKAPKSPYIPNAYLAFGELFFQEAQGDPSSWPLAEKAYIEVTKYPPPDNKVYGYARYKLAYTYWNTTDFTKALSEFKKVIEYGDQFAQLPNAKQLQAAARRDLVPVYAIQGKPEAAYAFFRPLAGDKGDSDEKTIEMMNQLGFAYLDTGHYPEAIALYQDLLKRDKGKRFCHYQTQITLAVQALKASDKESIIKELDRQVGVFKEFTASGNSDADKLECANRTAELLAETGMSWHLEAVGSGGVRGTGDQKTMDAAATLYKKVGENFTAQDFAKFKFPRIVKEDWPTLYKIRYAMADLLYFQQKWDKCGPAFDAVVAENPQGEDAAEAAYAAVLCYQKMYDQMYQGNADRKGKGLGPKGGSKEDQNAKKGEWEKFKPKPLSDMQKGMVTAFNRYICYIKPPKGDAEKEEQYVDVKFARARTYYEAQHWEEAALGFRDVAINHADKDAGIYAAQLYLEAMNVLGSRAEPPRPSCFTDMAADVPVFIDLYCKGKKGEDNKEQCEILGRIQFDILRLEAQKLVEKADGLVEKGSTAQALDLYKKGGDSYLELWRNYCEGPMGDGKRPKQCERADEIVYNMARAYQAGRLLAKSIQARLILLNDKYGMHKSDLAMKATYEIGGNYQAIADYDKAATWYERYADATKYKGEFAAKALSDAVVLRLGLGQEEKAIDGAKNYNRYYGTKEPQQTAQIAFAIAAHYGEKKEWNEVARQLGGGMALIDRSASTDVRVQAHALLGRAYVELNRATPASGEYKKVLGLWADPQKAQASIMALKEDDSAKERRLGRALEAVGEAYFHFAEQKRAKLDAVKFPEYKGAGVKDEVLKHIQTKVKDWYGKKSKLIQEASAEYKKVVDLQPAPPPRWVIAAGARVGSMWGTFVKEFRSAPIPKEWKTDDELRNTYYSNLDDASEPWKQQAKSAMEVCLGYSVKYQYFDDFSRSCEVWLSENYKSEFHLIDEFRGSPNRVNSAIREQAYPLRIGGEPLVETPKEPDAAATAGGDKKAADDKKAEGKKAGK